MRDAPGALVPGGLLAFEVGRGQAGRAGRLVEDTGAFGDARAAADPAGIPRVVHAERV